MIAAIPLAQLGRLNAFARKPQAFGPRNAIYAYKLLATLTLVAAGQAKLRFVKWTGKCIHCDGGWFTHWMWEAGDRVRCRDCRRTGKRTLHFTETTLPDGQVWHHPWEGRTDPGRIICNAAGIAWHDDANPIDWQDAGAWQPNQPGAELSVDDVAGALCDVEDWIDGASFHHLPQQWPVDSARRYLRRQKHRLVIEEPSSGYCLVLGRAAGGCHVCGDTQNHDTNLGCFNAGHTLEWTVAVCKTHRALGWPKTPPASLITPNVRRWLDRHDQVAEVA